MTARKRQKLTKKARPSKKACLLEVDGVPCTRPVYARGLCETHHKTLGIARRLNEFALPPKVHRKKKYEVNRDPKEGKCRVMEDRRPCKARAPREGVCQRHRQAIRRRKDLKLEDFLLSQDDIRPLTRRTAWRYGTSAKQGSNMVLRRLSQRTWKLFSTHKGSIRVRW